MGRSTGRHPVGRPGVQGIAIVRAHRRRNDGGIGSDNRALLVDHPRGDPRAGDGVRSRRGPASPRRQGQVRHLRLRPPRHERPLPRVRADACRRPPTSEACEQRKPVCRAWPPARVRISFPAPAPTSATLERWSERLKEQHWKCCKRATVSGVRIPPSPFPNRGLHKPTPLPHLRQGRWPFMATVLKPT